MPFHREKINRPHKVLRVDSIIDGLKRFRELYKGRIWLEVMLVRNLNDGAEELMRIRDVISDIGADRVFLNTVVRPPAEIYARPLSRDEVIGARKLLDNDCEVIAEFHGRRTEDTPDVENAIVEMAKRRPLTITDIANVLGISDENAEEYVNSLKDSGKLAEREQERARYLICTKN